MDDLWQRIRARKLVQWSAAYLAAAWLALQALDLLGNHFGWPGFVFRSAFVLLCAGLLLTLVLAWYHGEQGRQRVSGPELIILATLLGLTAVGLTALRPGSRTGSPIGEAASPVEQGSIAVLPLLDLSPGHDQAYFSDGLAEELLDVLARLPELRVAARTSSFSFRNKELAADSIGRALHVANVLEGSVRRAGERVRISVQLIDTRTGYQRWSETYDRPLRDVFAVQDEISRAIVGALQVKLGGGRAEGALAREETADPEAHVLVLKAIALLAPNTREGVTRGVVVLRQAIARDSGYARAHAQLARAYSMQAFLRYGPRDVLMAGAREETKRALLLDSGSADTHYVAGGIALYFDWDFRYAEKEYARALTLAPGFTRARTNRSAALLALGRGGEALEEAERAAKLDPFDWAAPEAVGVTHAYARHPSQAIAAFQAALAVAPEIPAVLEELAFSYSVLDRHGEAIAAAERARAQDPEDEWTLAALAYVYGRAGRRAEAERALRSLELQPDPSPFLLAVSYAGLGTKERVLTLLERAVAEKDITVHWTLATAPVFDPFRGEPRVREALDRMGLR